MAESVDFCNYGISYILSHSKTTLEKRKIDQKADVVHQEINKLDSKLNEVKTILQRMMTGSDDF